MIRNRLKLEFVRFLAISLKCFTVLPWNFVYRYTCAQILSGIQYMSENSGPIFSLIIYQAHMKALSSRYVLTYMVIVLFRKFWLQSEKAAELVRPWGLLLQVTYDWYNTKLDPTYDVTIADEYIIYNGSLFQIPLLLHMHSMTSWVPLLIKG